VFFVSGFDFESIVLRSSAVSNVHAEISTGLQHVGSLLLLEYIVMMAFLFSQQLSPFRPPKLEGQEG